MKCRARYIGKPIRYYVCKRKYLVEIKETVYKNISVKRMDMLDSTINSRIVYDDIENLLRDWENINPVYTPKTKKCSKCFLIKTTEKFGDSSGSSDGKRPECMECARKIGREHWYRIQEKLGKTFAQRRIEVIGY